MNSQPSSVESRNPSASPQTESRQTSTNALMPTLKKIMSKDTSKENTSAQPSSGSSTTPEDAEGHSEYLAKSRYVIPRRRFLPDPRANSHEQTWIWKLSVILKLTNWEHLSRYLVTIAKRSWCIRERCLLHESRLMICITRSTSTFTFANSITLRLSKSLSKLPNSSEMLHFSDHPFSFFYLHWNRNLGTRKKSSSASPSILTFAYIIFVQTALSCSANIDLPTFARICRTWVDFHLQDIPLHHQR